MTSTFSTTSPVVRVGIDIAKLTHQILWELPGGKRRSLRVANTKTEIDRFVGMLGALGSPCEIAFEATGDYHRPLAYVLGAGGLSSVLGFVHCCRPHTGGPVQLLGQERPEGRASHSASAEAGDDAALSRSAGDRASGPAGDGQHLPASLSAEGAAAAQPDHAPSAAVFSGDRAVSAQLPGRMGSPSYCSSRRVPAAVRRYTKTAFVAAALQLRSAISQILRV